MVEERHAEESLSVTQIVLQRRPALLSATIAEAKIMAQALDGVWSHLDDIVRAAGRKHGRSQPRPPGRSARSAS
jgi:hypothetical protein